MQAKRTFLKSLAALPLLALSLAGCSPLGAFNAVIPKDRGVTVVARGVSYGPEPRQKLDIYAPPEGAGNNGVVVFVYGGSWNSGSKSDYAFAGRAFAAQGFVTMVFDYRLVPAIRYPVFVEDSAKAVAWAYRNAATYGGDQKRLYLVGHSAGAYNAMMVALAPQFLQAEGLSPSILRAAAGLSGPYDFLPLDVDSTREAFSRAPDLPATQPINYVRPGRATPPIFVATGDADDLVKPRNTRALAAVLRGAGHRVEEKYYPGIDHAGTLLAIAKPLRKNAPVVEDVAGFFKAN